MALISLQGQGYPDILARSFLRMLHDTRPSIPIYGLVDYDPDGLAIFHTYAYGSASLAHENHALVVPSMEFLGLRAADLSASTNGYYAHFDKAEDELEPEAELHALSSRERRRAEKMLERSRDCVSEETLDSLGDSAEEDNAGKREMSRELQLMLMLGVKAEIQVLDRRHGGLDLWVRRKLKHY